VASAQAEVQASSYRRHRRCSGRPRSLALPSVLCLTCDCFLAQWNEALKTEFEHVRTMLPKADFRESLRLLEQAKARLGPRPATLMYPQDKIEHMVVLFVENRASDHIWGCMLGDRPGFDGIPSNSSDAKRCGTATLVCHGKYQDTAFNASQLPIKAAIADNYGVHNRMFTSVKGPSWPNHNFAQSATSCGISSNVMYNKCGGAYPQFPQATIFDSLKLADVPFGLYVNMTCGEGGEEPCSKVKPGWGTFSGNQSTGLDPDVTMAGVARHADHFFSHDLFYEQAANGTLPAFSWISPPHEAADHPCMDLAKGERLLKDIYEALRAGKGWSKTLFVVTYDDYGGFADHAPIPKAQPDLSPCNVWNKEHGLPPTAPTKCPGSDDFSTTGVRGVCAMMSPWVGKGAIFQEPTGPTNWSQYDHTSLLATAKSFFGLGGFLTERDKWAGSFDELLLDAPRADSDMPMHLPTPPKPVRPPPCTSDAATAAL
jgi:phospholipase C